MNNKRHCSICIRGCKTGDSFCHRRDENGDLIDNYGFCVCCVDHLFDKPIIYFGKNEKVLSIGSWGCNLRCLGCQNAALSCSVSGNHPVSIEMTPDQIVDMAVKYGCRGICYTYNEPAILLETIESIACKAKNAGLHNIFVSNSTLTEKSVHRIAGYIDAVAADIKSIHDVFYYVYCGAGGIPFVAKKILSCIKAFAIHGCHIEVRTNVIPGANDQKENLKAIASWIRDQLGSVTPWHITRFFPAHQLSDIKQTSTDSMLEAQRIGYEEGLQHVHTFFNRGCDCAKDTYHANVEPEYGITPIINCCNN